MADIQIIKLKPEDWQQYKQIRLEALLIEPQSFSRTYADALKSPDTFWQERLREAQKGERNWLLFASENDRLVGMIGAFRLEGGNEVEIISVYVTPAKRGQGVGKALMDAILIQVSQQAGVQKAVLGVNATQAPAVALYRRYGFQVVEETTGLMGDGQKYLGYWMEKPLRTV